MTLRSLLSITLTGFFLLVNTAIADDPDCVPWDSNTHPQRNDLLVGEIDIQPLNIFNPVNPLEQAWYHRLGNDLHVLTKPSTVRPQVIFKTGEPLDLRLLDETERILRSKSYLKSAVVVPQSVCGQSVNVQIETVDHWTFTPSLSIDRVGDKNTSSFEVEESNLFGYGKHISIEYDEGIDRTSRSIRYNDPNLFSSFLQFGALYRDNSDGAGYATDIELPFYHLNSHRAWGMEMSNLDETVSLYDQGEVFNEFQRETELWGISAGWSKGLKNGIVDRYRTGWWYSDKRYDALDDTLEGTVPLNRKLSYPWVSFERINEGYVEIPNLTTMDETQDIGLGHRYSVKLGAAPASFGADRNYGILDLKFSANYQPTPSQLNGIYGEISNVFGSGYQRNTRIKGGFNWYHFGSAQYIWYLAGHLMHDTHPLPDQQVLLGGETGLRGYPIRYQAGQSKVLLSAEQRHMYSVYPWRLIQVASAVFVDIGRSWNNDENPPWLSDVGLGLRLFPTRSTGQTVIHVDLAFPIGAADDVDRMQFSISTKAGF